MNAHEIHQTIKIEPAYNNKSSRKQHLLLITSVFCIELLRFIWSELHDTLPDYEEVVLLYQRHYSLYNNYY